MNRIAYICDQEVPYCKRWCRYILTECRHTFDRDHAKNGKINPDLVRSYPDRFVCLGSRDGIYYYEEVE